MYNPHGHPLESLKEAKYLGLTNRQDLKWNSLVSITSARKPLNAWLFTSKPYY